MSDVIAVGTHQQRAHLATRRIVADDARNRHFAFESAEHIADVRRAAEPCLALIGPQHNDRRFLADALGVAPV